MAAVGLRTAQPPRAGSKRPGGDREGGESGASPRGLSASFRTASLRSRPPVRGRAPSRHLPGPTPSQRPPALGPSAEAALPPAPGLKWLRNKENLGSGERRSDWPRGGARRGNFRRRSPWQRRRDWENLGPGLTGLRTCARRRAAAVSKPALQQGSCGLGSRPAAGLASSCPRLPGRWPEPLAGAEPPRTLCAP